MSRHAFLEAVELQRQEALRRIGAVPVSVLLWGPNATATGSVAATRRELRVALESDGHLVRYSEELYNSASPYSLLAQQVADVEAHDITFSFPDSPGSIAEAHDFARIPSISHRIVTFVDGDHTGGYASKTLLELQSTASCRVQIYKASDLPGCVLEYARGLVRRLQEFYYLSGRRF